jgi:hypothetical protein
LDDPKVWEVFNKDKVTGIFQFEGQAVRGLMRQVTVTSFEDLCALTSLARPGPLNGGAAALWVDRKSGRHDWKSLIPALDPTFGLIVYQEQAMAIVRELAGFNEFDVNGFRRAIGKKDPLKLKAYHDQFVSGARERSKMSDIELEDLWQQMEDFGSYAFNYSHAVAYSMISYYTAYAKAYYPDLYALAYLKHAPDEEAEKSILREYGRDRVVICDPELSEVNWSVKDGKLIGGLTNLKGVGPKMAQKFIDLRTADPVNWKENLTSSQRSKLVGETRLDDMYFFDRYYGDVYSYPARFRISDKVWKIEDIPAEKGDYIFLGRLTKIMVREKDGQEYALAFFSDDTGEMPCTISKKNWPEFKFGPDGKPTLKIDVPYVVRGDIINEGRKWLFINKARKLHEPTNNDPTEPDADPKAD